ncbi:MAG: hypothetical protein JXB20_03170 [Bacilli bacterium]|nr:hypothetical protein [Bacilli bacterium]
MNCLTNISRTPIPNDVFIASLKLYYQMGRNDEYDELFSDNLDYIRQQMASEEATAFFRLFFADHKLPESRLRSLQLESTVARTKAEILFKNIHKVFQMIHNPKAEPFHLNVTEINDLVKLMFRNVLPQEKLQYRKLESKKHQLIASDSISLREQLEQLIAKLTEIKKTGLYEPLFLELNFLVDFTQMEVYKFNENHIVGLLVFYIMVMQEKVIASRYVSFFNKLFMNKEEFLAVLDKSRFGWSEGFAEIMPLHRFMLRIYHELYLELQEYARDYEYESKLEISKSDYIENTIDKLPEVFQKEDIRIKHPFISDSTINRTLKRMQEENKIRPLGKGRSAKWIKLYRKETGKYKVQQLNLDLGEEN